VSSPTSSSRSEFDLIKRYFTGLGNNQFVKLGVGDDAAITSIPAGYELVTTVDTLVADVHFFADTAPELIGYKSLAVNLSDLAAMSATPVWFTLSLAVPEIDESWLQAFSRGLTDLALQYSVALVGGDTVRGPLTITIQACGIVEQGKALLRDGAKVGDGIYITGPLGDARLALELLKGDRTIDKTYLTACCDKLHKPVARIKEGLLLKEFANAAIDISDGLVADLSHVLQRSDVGARIFLDDLPVSDAMRKSVSESESQNRSLYGGDDYELCFTVPTDKQDAMLSKMKANDCVVYRIGTIAREKGLFGVHTDGDASLLEQRGYDHFS